MDLNTILIVAGAALLGLGLLSRLIKRLFISSVLLALIVGVADCSSGRASISPEFDEPYVRITASNHLAGSVGRTVIHHDRLRTLGQLLKLPKSTSEMSAPIQRRDDHSD